MKHRIFLGVLSLFCLLLVVLAPDAQAAERWEDGWNPEITYEFDAATGTITLTGTGEITTNKSHYKPWGNYAKNVKKVVIGEGITGIGAYTFSSLQNLTEVVLPQSLTTIRSCAFQNCNSLSSINTSYVTTLEEYAFSECCRLANIDISRVTSIDQYVFQSCGLRSVTIPRSITVIPRGAFINCRSLSSLTLHDQITKIGYDAFNDCYQLTSLQMPKSLKELDDYAFADCIYLTDIQLNNGLELIGRGALNGCKALKTLTIPDSVKTIEDDAFSGCYNLQSIHFGAGLSDITYTAFGRCTSLTTFTISKNNPTWEVHDNGLYNKKTKKLEVVAPAYAGAYTVPTGALTIGRDAFYEGKVTSVTIPDTVKLIEEYAFAFCKNLKTVTLGNSIEEIKTNAFFSSSITEITIPASVKKMGGGTFSYCSSLTKITFLGLPPEVGSGVAQVGSVTVYYPGYLSEWKNAAIHALGYYFDYVPDCMGRHDLRWEVIKTPTCKETGWRSETWCIVCRETVDPEGELPLADHSYSAWTTVNAPTAEKEGLSKRTCKVCGASEQKTIAKLNASTEPPTSEPSTPPATEPSQPVTSAPQVTFPSVPDETQPITPSDPVPTEPDPQEDSSPAPWIPVVIIAAASILIGMVVSFLIFAFKKYKSKG